VFLTGDDGDALSKRLLAWTTSEKPALSQQEMKDMLKYAETASPGLHTLLKSYQPHTCIVKVKVAGASFTVS